MTEENVFSSPGYHFLSDICAFLAVHDCSIGDIVVKDYIQRLQILKRLQ